jgi:hypothetical protein
MCYALSISLFKSVLPQSRKRKRTFTPKKQSGAQAMRAARLKLC